MIIDGKQIASDVLAKVRAGVEKLGYNPIVGVIVIRPSAATESYLRIKRARAEEAGMLLDLIRMEDDASAEDVLRKIHIYDKDALIVQLPLPEGFDRTAILDAIPAGKDADVLSTTTYEQFLSSEKDTLLPPVVAAIEEVLTRSSVAIAGKRAVIVGNGRLVGSPAAAWLAAQGAEVTVLDRESFESRSGELRGADIIIAGAGSPHLITPDHVSEGVVLIDAGTSESNGAIVGDIDPACAKKASVFTPVPGGIGPLAVACLFKNALVLAERRHFAD
jgi:methylenetetrahydrofolate dehydrogenase (NADP+)/methenyltetrahydrofolate cyclohydrolase